MVEDTLWASPSWTVTVSPGDSESCSGSSCQVASCVVGDEVVVISRAEGSDPERDGMGDNSLIVEAAQRGQTIW